MRILQTWQFRIPQHRGHHVAHTHRHQSQTSVSLLANPQRCSDRFHSLGIVQLHPSSHCQEQVSHLNMERYPQIYLYLRNLHMHGHCLTSSVVRQGTRSLPSGPEMLGLNGATNNAVAKVKFQSSLNHFASAVALKVSLLLSPSLSLRPLGLTEWLSTNGHLILFAGLWVNIGASPAHFGSVWMPE